MSGVPAVFFKRNRKADLPTERDALPIQRLPVRENYITTDVQDAKRSIMNEFLTAIGVNNANTDKRERLISNEVDANNAELVAAVGLWQDNIDRQIEKAVAMFPELTNNLSVKFGRGLTNDTIRPNGSIQTTAEQDGR